MAWKKTTTKKDTKKETKIREKEKEKPASKEESEVQRLTDLLTIHVKHRNEFFEKSQAELGKMNLNIQRLEGAIAYANSLVDNGEKK